MHAYIAKHILCIITYCLKIDSKLVEGVKVIQSLVNLFQYSKYFTSKHKRIHNANSISISLLKKEGSFFLGEIEKENISLLKKRMIDVG